MICKLWEKGSNNHLKSPNFTQSAAVKTPQIEPRQAKIQSFFLLLMEWLGSLGNQTLQDAFQHVLSIRVLIAILQRSDLES
jgi:hypothetical protein